MLKKKDTANHLRILWLTDLHLEFVSSSARLNALFQEIRSAQPDSILVGGDTGTAPSVEAYLLALEEQLQVPIYFVLGNHDFYRGSIWQVREVARKLSQRSNMLYWLPAEGVIELSANTALIGHGGWADGRLGNSSHSTVQLNDYLLIEEFIGLNVERRFQKLNVLGDEAAEHFHRVLPEAVNTYPNVLLLTHVPPFRDACWHEGQISDDEFLPHFTCKAVGDVLLEIMKGHSESHLTVLCGHTHGQGEVEILPNLLVKTGGAEYGEPKMQNVFHVE
ncbi:MAG: metallophosphoesterase [Chloroflexota bacterium]